jgi:anthranilate 1,2-dioxygenase small subunit/terephthalate 1,2-dioxygenase oxygenase component beta subunit
MLAESNSATGLEHQLTVQDLNARYVEAIDDDKLEAWPDFFTEDGCYLITTAENVAQNLPLGMMYATSRAMLRDRVRALREANVYETQRYRHILGAPRIITSEGSAIRARSGFIVVRIMHTGEMTIFATGSYEDKVLLDPAGGARFADKTVVLDSRAIDTLLAIPL